MHINADTIGHALLQKPGMRKKVVHEFGKGIISGNRIDRSKLKQIVFHDPSQLKRLNRIMHPAIIREIENIIGKNKDKDIVLDAPLLIELKAHHLVDKILVVKIKKSVQLQRLGKKKKYTQSEIKNIMKSQLSQKEKLKYADIVIDNSGTMIQTQKQMEAMR